MILLDPFYLQRIISGLLANLTKGNEVTHQNNEKLKVQMLQPHIGRQKPSKTNAVIKQKHVCVCTYLCAGEAI